MVEEAFSGAGSLVSGDTLCRLHEGVVIGRTRADALEARALDDEGVGWDAAYVAWAVPAEDLLGVFCRLSVPQESVTGTGVDVGTPAVGLEIV